MSDNEVKKLARELAKLPPKEREKKLNRLIALAQKKKADQSQQSE